ncbi:hypothetical protein Osc1_19950 [Hominimerdicola sp. 21CYCFAH17_S]
MKLYYQIKDFILDLHTKRSMFIIMIIALQLSLSNEAFKTMFELFEDDSFNHGINQYVVIYCNVTKVCRL